MKYLFVLLITCSIFTSKTFAQMPAMTTIPPVDKSVMDMSTYPANYPLLKIQDKANEPIAARVIYSRPLKSGRVIFGELLEYNKVWRFGANENTEVEFFRDVKIKNVKVKKGRYSVFAIPNSDKWTLIFNKDLNTWGSFKYEVSKDVLKVDVPTQKTSDIAEAFYIYFEKATTGFSMNAGWDDVKVSLPISF
jgi:Protein of unknown function (DUF2911)